MMTQPTDKHRQAAREVMEGVNLHAFCDLTYDELQTRIAQALANTEAAAFTAGRDEAAETVRRRLSSDDIASRRLRESLTAAILAPTSGPTYEQKIRAEIAEAVEKLSRLGIRIPEHEDLSYDPFMSEDSSGNYLRRDDVLAAIQRSEK